MRLKNVEMMKLFRANKQYPLGSKERKEGVINFLKQAKKINDMEQKLGEN